MAFFTFNFPNNLKTRKLKLRLRPKVTDPECTQFVFYSKSDYTVLLS